MCHKSKCLGQKFYRSDRFSKLCFLHFPVLEMHWKSTAVRYGMWLLISALIPIFLNWQFVTRTSYQRNWESRTSFPSSGFVIIEEINDKRREDIELNHVFLRSHDNDDIIHYLLDKQHVHLFKERGKTTANS